MINLKMHQSFAFRAVATSAFIVAANAAASLNSVCTSAYARTAISAVPYQGLTVDLNSIVANPVSNFSISGQTNYPDANFDYCNVTLSYSHDGLNDTVNLGFWLPTPANFANRWLSTGGGAYKINSGTGSLPGGVQYGAVSGVTDGGFGSFNTNFDNVFLIANGTINWHNTYMFGYQAHHEMSIIGKQFTKGFFNMSDTKLYAYYQACSEGGREGWSQVQRFGDEWDGAVIGAPAFRFGFQQPNHLFPNLVQQTLDYNPPSCEMDAIINATINACDAYDGRIDGVISRTDLCKLNFDLDSLVGETYSCAASSSMGMPLKKRQIGMGGSTTPAQNGTITTKGIELAKTLLNGLRDTQGRQAYVPYQYGATFADLGSTYNSTTKKWDLSISGVGGEWVARFLGLKDTSSLDSIAGYTYDTLRDIMVNGSQIYADSLQTNYPDLTPFHAAGGKVLHYHGESDNSVPTASSVRYWESVRTVMYPEQTRDESFESLNDWYRLFLVPGAAHCGTNSLEPNGPWPQTNLAVLIEWVENDVVPNRLNATHLAGAYKGQRAEICAWPKRPFYTNNGTTLNCVFNEDSWESWQYDLDAIKLPVY